MKIKTFISIVYRTFLPMAVLSMALSSCNKEFPNNSEKLFGTT